MSSAYFENDVSLEPYYILRFVSEGPDGKNEHFCTISRQAVIDGQGEEVIPENLRLALQKHIPLEENGRIKLTVMIDRVTENYQNKLF